MFHSQACCQGLGRLQPEQGSVWDTQERTGWLAAEVGQGFI